MGDMGEMFREMRKSHQATKQSRGQARTADLIARGIPFATQAAGNKLVITLPDGQIVDAWPTTGKWKMRKGQKRACLHWNKLIKILGECYG